MERPAHLSPSGRNSTRPTGRACQGGGPLRCPRPTRHFAAPLSSGGSTSGPGILLIGSGGVAVNCPRFEMRSRPQRPQDWASRSLPRFFALDICKDRSKPGFLGQRRAAPFRIIRFAMRLWRGSRAFPRANARNIGATPNSRRASGAERGTGICASECEQGEWMCGGAADAPTDLTERGHDLRALAISAGAADIAPPVWRRPDWSRRSGSHSRAVLQGPSPVCRPPGMSCQTWHGSLRGVSAKRRAVSLSRVPPSTGIALREHPAARAVSDRVEVNHGCFLRPLDHPQRSSISG
jgi:hypothetical protein